MNTISYAVPLTCPRFGIILIRVDKNADGHITEAEVKEVNKNNSPVAVLGVFTGIFSLLLLIGDISIELFRVF
jgi:hypothetical protein